MKKFWSMLLKPKSYYAKILLLLTFIALSTSFFSGYLEPVQELLEQERFTIKLGSYNITLYYAIKSIIAIVVVFWLTAIISEFGEKRIRKIRVIHSHSRIIITKIFQTILYFMAFLFTLDFIGIDLKALAVLSGAVGIGVGFGLQKITSNFISGLILLFENSVKEGDVIELNDGTFCNVKRTVARYTLVETPDGREIMIPNEEFITNRVTNWTYSNKKARIDVKIGVSYDADLEKVKEIMLEAARQHPRCMKDPEPSCFLREFGDSSVNFLLMFWVEDVVEGRFCPHSEVMFSIWNKFKEHGIEIPYPKRDLYIKEMPKISA